VHARAGTGFEASGRPGQRGALRARHPTSTIAGAGERGPGTYRPVKRLPSLLEKRSVVPAGARGGDGSGELVVVPVEGPAAG
jgi:hypothetical protein